MADKALYCAQCNVRLHISSYDPSKEYGCPQCQERLTSFEDAPTTQERIPTCHGEPSVHDPLIGQTIGESVIIEKIGEGGMGMVYLAREKTLDRLVAIKLLARQNTRDPTDVERFIREARAAAQLDHPNTVIVHGTGQTEDGEYYIKMQYVPGATAFDLLGEGEALDIDEALRIARDAAQGLGAAHEIGIVHRDVKPSNILVRDKDGKVLVTDFGLARDLGHVGKDLTEPGYFVGTPHYMSPEQGEGRTTDARSDIYSLGATLYHMLTGNRPFEGDSLVSILRQHSEAPLPSPKKHRPEIPDAVCAIVEKAMAKRPEDRYQSCDELVRDFSAILAPATTERPIDRAAAVTQKDGVALIRESTGEGHWAKFMRNRLAVVVTIATGVLLVCVIGWQVVKRLPKRTAGSTTKDHDLSRDIGEVTKGTAEGTTKGKPSAATPEAKLPSGFEKAFMLPDSDKDQHGNPVVVRNGSRSDPKTSYPHEIWLKQPRMESVLIPAGEFLMGSTDEEIERLSQQHIQLMRNIPDMFKQEGPQHRVRITKPFYLAKYEVTVSQFRWFVDKTGYQTQVERSGGAKVPVEGRSQQKADANWRNPYFEQGDTHPVVCVSWDDALAFCKGLADVHGGSFALPTEAQWEYASRAGSRGPYCFGDHGAGQDLADYGWIGYSSGGTSHAVGEKKPNNWGLYDMHGNAREWCADWHGEYGTGQEQDPMGPAKGSTRVCRGGSWMHMAKDARSAYRVKLYPNFGFSYAGFRVLVGVPSLGVGQQAAPAQHALAGGRPGKYVLWKRLGSTVPVPGPDGKVQQLPAGAIADVKCSPDGKYVAIGHSHGVDLYDIKTWKIVRRLDDGESAVETIAFSADGRKVATGSYDGMVRIWQTDTGAQLRAIKAGQKWINAVAFSPDGRHLALATQDRYVRIWPVDAGTQPRSMGGHTHSLKCVAFSPNGKRLVSGGSDRTARIWDVDTGTAVQVLEGHKGELRSVAFSPDGRHIASASLDKTVRLWIAETGEEEQVLRGHAAAVSSAAFSADGRQILSAASDKTAIIWDAGRGTQLRTLRGHLGFPHSAELTPDGRHVVSASANEVRIWDATTGKEQRLLETYAAPVYAVAVSGGGGLLAWGEYGGGANVWDIKAGAERWSSRPDSPANVFAIDFDPSDSMIATPWTSGTLVIWDAATGAKRHVLKSRAGAVRALAFSPDGRLLASSGASEKAVRLWDVQTGAEVKALPTPADVARIVFSPDGEFLAATDLGSAPHLRGVRFWNVTTAQEAWHVLKDDAYWGAIAFGPNGSRLACGGNGGVQIRDTKTGQEIIRIAAPGVAVTSVAFSPDGHRLAVADREGWVRFWGSTTGRELARLKGHRGKQVNAVVFDRGGRFLVSGGGDGTVCLWRATDAAQDPRGEQR